MNPHSTIVQPGRTACDAYPRCPFKGQGDALRDHMRECPTSEVGGIYRTLRIARDIAEACKEVAS